VREHKQHWEEETRTLKQKLESLEAGAGDLNNAEKSCLSVRERLKDATPERNKAFIQLVVERIWVDENNNLDIEVIVPKVEKHADNSFAKPLSPERRGGDN
jgi:hypothetical protein